jgi:ubiquinone/menaquinone biosynthesis C-methylase UbiE
VETILNSLLQEVKISSYNNLVLDYLESSESADFYKNLFDSKNEVEKPELYHELKQTAPELQGSKAITEKIISVLEGKLDKNAVVIEIGGGVYQSRSANAYKRFINYFPLDISATSIERYASTYNRPGIVADATKLPFIDNSIDCIFTQTFLEHPLEPEKVLSEICRVLKPGGIIIHNDAWFCRWWQRYGIINLKRFKNMAAKEKLIFLSAKITEFPLVRIPPIIAGRIFRKFFVSETRPLNLPYKKLKPNYTLYLGCDEDAASSIDPINVVRFYESRGFKLSVKLSLKQRLFYPNKWIMLEKLSMDGIALYNF